VSSSAKITEFYIPLPIRQNVRSLFNYDIKITFKSRCTTPYECKYSNPSNNYATNFFMTFSLNFPYYFIIYDIDPPVIYSIKIYIISPSWRHPKYLTIQGWENLCSIFISCIGCWLSSLKGLFSFIYLTAKNFPDLGMRPLYTLP